MLFETDKRFFDYFGLSYVHRDSTIGNQPYIIYNVYVDLFHKSPIDVSCGYTQPPYYVDLTYDASLATHFLTQNGIGYWLDSSNNVQNSKYKGKITDTRRYLNYYGFMYLWNTTLDPEIFEDTEHSAEKIANDENVAVSVDEETGEIVLDVDMMNTLYGGYDFLLSATNSGLLQIFYDSSLSKAVSGEMDEETGEVSVTYNI